MQKLLKFSGLLGIVVVIGLLSTSIPTTAYADMGDVKERRALMKTVSKNLTGAFGFVKGKGGTPESVAANARALAASAAKMSKLFSAGTGRDKLGAKATRAKADIWQDKAKFDRIAAKLEKLAHGLEAAARTGDKKKIGMAAGAIGKQTCGGCHKAFRGPKHKG